MSALQNWITRVKDGDEHQEMFIDSEFGVDVPKPRDLTEIKRAALRAFGPVGFHIDAIEMPDDVELHKHVMMPVVALGDAEKNMLIAKLVHAARYGIGYGSNPPVSVMATPDTFRDAWISALAYALIIGEMAPVLLQIEDPEGTQPIEVRRLQDVTQELCPVVAYG